jgi:hypothetical protein
MDLALSSTMNISLEDRNGRGELVTADKSMVNTESLFDAIVMEDLQSVSGSPGTDESDG